MTASAKKFVYTLQAVYEGKGDVKKLSSDLKELKSIEVFDGLQKSFAKTNADFATAKTKLRELKKIMREPGGDAYAESYEKARVNVEKLSKSVVNQKTKLLESSAALKKSGVNVGDLTGEYKKLEASTKKQGTIMAAQAKLGVKSTKQIEREVESLEQAYKDLQKSGVFSLEEMSGYKQKMEGDITRLRTETTGWRDDVDTVEEGWLGVAGVIATLAGTFEGIRLTAEFDDSMRSVKAVMGGTADDFQRLTDFAKELGSTTRFTASEAAEGMEELAQSGMKVEEIFKTLPDAMNVSSISGGSIKEAADLITDTLKQFGLEVSESGRVTDVLVKGFTQASTSLEDLGSGLSYAGPILASFGYNVEDTVGILDALAEAGFKGSRGGTALVGGMTRLIKPSKKAAAILEKYNIQVLDSHEKVRAFADVLEDVGDAALNPAEMLEVFGQEAGPGMAGLLGQGADAIRKFQTQLLDVEGVAERIAGDKEAGIGGALRSLGSSLQSIVLSFGDAFAPAIVAVAQAFTELARLVTAMPESLKVLTGSIALGVAGLSVWFLGLNKIFRVLSTGAGALRRFTAASTTTSRALRLAGRAFSVWAAFDIGYTIGGWLNKFDIVKKAGISFAAGLTKSFLMVKKAWTWMTGGDVAAVQAELDQAEQIFFEMFDAVGKKAKEVAVLQKQAHSEVTASAKDAASDQVQAQEEALAKMQAQYEQHVSKIKTLQDSIAASEQSLYEYQRDLARTGMSDIDAYADLKKQAEQYRLVAEKALGGGDNETALKYFKLMEDAFKSLATEVKTGDNVLIDQQSGIKTKMDGVTDAVNGQIKVMGELQDAEYAAMEALSEESGWQNLSKNMDEAKQNWLNAWQDMRAKSMSELDVVEKRLDQVVKDRETNIYYNIKEKRADGGVIGSAQHLAAGGRVSLRNMLAGGRFPGYGGGDRRHVVAEDGEVMLRKESVRKGGLMTALAFNAGRFDLVVKELMSRFRFSPEIFRATGGPVNFMPSLPPLPSPQMLATGGAVTAPSFGGDTFNLNLSFAGNVSQPSRQNAKEMAAMVMAEMQRMHKRSSK